MLGGYSSRRLPLALLGILLDCLMEIDGVMTEECLWHMYICKCNGIIGMSSDVSCTCLETQLSARSLLCQGSGRAEAKPKRRHGEWYDSVWFSYWDHSQQGPIDTSIRLAGTVKRNWALRFYRRHTFRDERDVIIAVGCQADRSHTHAPGGSQQGRWKKWNVYIYLLSLVTKIRVSRCVSRSNSTSV